MRRSLGWMLREMSIRRMIRGMPVRGRVMTVFHLHARWRTMILGFSEVGLVAALINDKRRQDNCHDGEIRHAAMTVNQ
jgi:hypothetical protein